MTVCPKCKGYGIVGSAVPDILRGRGAIFSSNECDMCHGSGEVQMTNEEWFCGLSTEEKARFLDKICYSAWGDINSRFKDMADYTDWIEWLKEIHQ